MGGNFCRGDGKVLEIEVMVNITFNTIEFYIKLIKVAMSCYMYFLTIKK